MNKVLVSIGQLVVFYAIGGLVTICDPVLVSEEAAQSSKVLRVAKDITDCVINGYKIGFMIPVIGVAAILKKEEA